MHHNTTATTATVTATVVGSLQLTSGPEPGPEATICHSRPEATIFHSTQQPNDISSKSEPDHYGLLQASFTIIYSFYVN
jgi:hypothetical protein